MKAVGCIFPTKWHSVPRREIDTYGTLAIVLEWSRRDRFTEEAFLLAM